MKKIAAGDIASVDNGNSLRLVIGIVEDTVYLKPLQYDSCYMHYFPINRITVATDEQIVEWLSYYVNLENLRGIV